MARGGLNNAEKNARIPCFTAVQLLLSGPKISVTQIVGSEGICCGERQVISPQFPQLFLLLILKYTLQIQLSSIKCTQTCRICF